jgi:hypothetical protein
MHTIWFVPMKDDTRHFDTPEGKPIEVHRGQVQYVWQDEGSAWCEVMYAGRVRLVRAEAEDIRAWIKAGGFWG